MAKAGELDVVGYEYEVALEVCKDQGIEPVLEFTGAAYGQDSGEEALRVVRQQWRGESLILTCAREVWS